MTAPSPHAIETPEPGGYRIDPARSVISYSGRQLFGLGTVHATFNVNSGDIEVRDPLADSTATVSVDAGSFYSSSARRDRDVRSRGLLDVLGSSEITFSAHGLRELGDAWLLLGSVTVRGRSAPVNVIVDSERGRACGSAPGRDASTATRSG